MMLFLFIIVFEFFDLKGCDLFCMLMNLKGCDLCVIVGV